MSDVKFWLDSAREWAESAKFWERQTTSPLAAGGVRRAQRGVAMCLRNAIRNGFVSGKL